MSKEAPKAETPLKIGQMPKPKFLEIPSPFENGNKPIGIMAASPIDGKEKPFIWWRNFLYSNLFDEEGRNAVAAYVTRLILDYKAEIVIGSAVDLEKSDVRTGKVKVLPKLRGHGQYGYYIEASRRLWFGVDAKLKGPATEEELRLNLSEKGKPRVFDETFEKVKSSLPDLK